MSPAQLARHAAEVARAKLVVRQSIDWRTILYRMEIQGDDWWYDADGELRVSPLWTFPVCPEHQRAVNRLEPLNARLQAINAEMMGR